MKTKNDEISTSEDPKGKKMTRKAAISKAGLIAISAATTMLLLGTPKQAHASAPSVPDAEPSGGTWTKRT